MRMLLLLCLFSTALYAGSQDKRSIRQIDCEREAMGSLYRSHGHAAKVIWIARADMVGDEPLDGIHIRDDGETPAQRASWESSLLRGWHRQDDWMGAHDGAAREPRDVVADCLAGEDA